MPGPGGRADGAEEPGNRTAGKTAAAAAGGKAVTASAGGGGQEPARPGSRRPARQHPSGRRCRRRMRRGAAAASAAAAAARQGGGISELWPSGALTGGTGGHLAVSTKTKASASISTKTGSLTSTKTSASTSTGTKHIKKYFPRPLPQAQPSHHSHAILMQQGQHRLLAAPTLHPHNSSPRSHRAHAAPTQPPMPPSRRSHTAPTSPSFAAALPPRRLHTATPPQRHPHAAARSPHSDGPTARSSHAALTPAEFFLHATRTLLSHRCNATATPPLRRRNVSLTPLHFALTRPSRHPHACCTLLLTVPGVPLKF